MVRAIQDTLKHPAMNLADIVGDLIEDYETLHLRLPDTTDIDTLKFLMQQAWA